MLPEGGLRATGRSDASEWLKNPELEVVQTTKGSGLGSSFTLFADQVTTAGQDNADGGGGQPRGRKGGKVMASTGARQ